MNEFEQILFTDYNLIVDDVDKPIDDFDDEGDDDDDRSIMDDHSIDIEPDIYEDTHPWDSKRDLQMRFYPKYWAWYPHELL